MSDKQVKGYPDYTVTDTGKVFRRGKEIKSYDNGHGYRQVKLWKDGKRVTKQVSRLVAGEPAGKDVDHINFNKSDNSAANLQSISHQDNVKRNFTK